MTRTMIAAATAALLAMAGCGESETGEADNQAVNQGNAAAGAVDADSAGGDKDPGNDAGSGEAGPQASEASAGGPSATASSPSSEIRALLVGRWAEGGDCAAAIDIRADGTFSSPAGQGRWTLESEYLDLVGAGPAIAVAVQEIDRREMTTINPQGRIGRWTRC